jgi:hypothetical protein
LLEFIIICELVYKELFYNFLKTSLNGTLPALAAVLKWYQVPTVIEKSDL